MRELVLAIILTALMGLIYLIPEDVAVLENARLTFSFGFLLSAGYITGLIFSRIKLPKISGYLFAGMIFGPHILNIIDTPLINNMTFINQLALTFIALNAGGELRLKELVNQKKQILWLIFLLISFIFAGMLLFTFASVPLFPFLRGAPNKEILIVGALLGTLAIARSPSSIIAIIQECKASGPFTETVLGVTVAIDFLVIMIFAVVVSFSEALLDPLHSISAIFLIGVALQVVVSAIAGIIIGMGVAAYIRKVKMNVPILLLVLSFLIYNISGVISDLITANLNVSFHLEPLLIAITAGFYIQNYTKGGHEFIESIENSSLPVYVLFFAITGLVLDVGILMDLLFTALIIAVVRGSIAMISGYTAGRISGAPVMHSKSYGMGFITQAGVSIGLANEIIRRFPEWGLPLGTLIIAVINFNQVIGPITFKLALGRVGEIHQRSAGLKKKIV